MNNFFEGKDFEDGVFKALRPEYYPPKYKKYIQEETEFLIKKLTRNKRILEAGVGIGRLIPVIAPAVKELVGIDNAQRMLNEAQKVSEGYDNVIITQGDLEHLEHQFGPRSFDVSLCLWNTLGNVEDEVVVLDQLRRVTNGPIFITVYSKGTVKDRKNWYKTVNIPIQRIDQEHEIFYTRSGLRSKSYSLADLKQLAEHASLNIIEHSVLGGVVLWVGMEGSTG